MKSSLAGIAFVSILSACSQTSDMPKEAMIGVRQNANEMHGCITAVREHYSYSQQKCVQQGARIIKTKKGWKVQNF
ncbi:MULTISPECIES: hypothetical protein [Rodentibacter]|uniref:hypothetical protein n=1 Tax=Rodentibacter TaxID=1960084 RepID=UPI001CFEB168|nr:hypothetical protein [Rodentibacter sp. JRC1]GJI56419.1 hypothetical protein HEMROJRC1_15310 [Rodentibacter sp. JRC1]